MKGIFMKNKKNRHYQKKRNSLTGFTLLISSLIASLMLVVGLAVFNITFKELRLSSTSRDSQVAFYAADTGMECALFWDFKHIGYPYTVFATSTNYEGTINPGITCAGIDITADWLLVDPPVTTVDAATSTFNIDIGDSCAIVTVAKFGSPIKTKVESRGQTLCGTNSPRRVERAIRVKY